MQTVTVDGQEALFIPAGGQTQLAGGQTIIAPQILRSPVSLVHGQTLQFPGGQNVSVRPGNMATAAQVVQLQQSIPVQVPISTGNGQTVYQTVHFPLQAFTSIPNLLHTNQQMSAPQMAQILTPSGQVQQVQVVGGGQGTLVVQQPNISTSQPSSQSTVIVQPSSSNTSTTTTTSMSSPTVTVQVPNIQMYSVQYETYFLESKRV
ncbi:hypothetical protein AAG570_001939 [Ranatra chinensis]|uniref:Uncharacterized protein n=1 Tax=Ranatra chinensis TaxID=642074 RepID=A0ABD0YY85_9HEMI